MPRSYDLDPDGAAKAGTSNYISKTDEYIGTFTAAVAVQSKQGTDGIEFSFKTNEGQVANFLQLWTFNTEGRQLYGHAVLSAILACLRQRSIQSRAMTMDGKPVEGFPDLCGKSIGLLLQREEYYKQDGSVGFKFNISAPFEPQSRKVAAEILKSLPAEKLPQMVAALRDKPVQARREPAHASGGSQSGDWTNDPEIPF